MTLATIESYRKARHIITAYHHVVGNDPCSHSAVLDWSQLEEAFGAGFNIPERHDEFVGRLRCSKCHRKGSMSIIIAPPTR